MGSFLAPLSPMPSYTVNDLAAAVAQQESGNQQYNSSGGVLTSSAGALGIMQLMPSTAAGLGVDPNNPTQNVAGGTTYLSQLLAKFGGNANNALAAYNWGPGNVSKALASGTPFPSSVQSYSSSVLQKLQKIAGISSALQPFSATGSLLGVLSGSQSLTNPGTTTPISDSLIGRGTTIGVGLLLIAAGVFSFKNAPSIIQVASKAASKVAEVTA